jgi:hypothetical protein
MKKERERRREEKREEERERDFSKHRWWSVYESHFAFIVFICLSHNLLEN